jgi:PII-like signaling protein
MNIWKQLTIYLVESDRWHRQPLYLALIEKARERGLAGATVTRAIAGFGNERAIRTSRVLALSADLPIVVTIIDREDAIAQFLPTVRTMVKSGLISLQTVEVLLNHV